MLSIQYPVCNASVLFSPSEDELKQVVPIVEGVKELDALCPVNHVTGDRQSPLDLLNLVLSPDRKDLLGKFLQNITPEMSMSQLDDVSMLEILPSRLSTGTPAEDALFAKQLEKVIDVCGDSLRSMFASAESKNMSKRQEPESKTIEAEAE